MLLIIAYKKLLSQIRFGIVSLSHTFYIFFYTYGKFYNNKKYSEIHKCLYLYGNVVR